MACLYVLLARHRYILADLPTTKVGIMAKGTLDFRKLSIAERLQLVADIWDSIAEETGALPLTDAQKTELDRRIEQHERDPDSAIPWEQVREELHKRSG
jgi:putative addiction module component (TIGR02574 family)